MTKIRQKAGPKRLVAGDAAEESVKVVRQEITDVIVESSLDMTKSVVRAVKRRGSAASMRFLWSIAGILPEAGVSKPDAVASSMQTLVEKLGLYQKPTTSANPQSADVKSLEL